MMMMDVQHCAWFVASLTPHLRKMLSQQKLSTQEKALEIATRLHETPIHDLGLGVSAVLAVNGMRTIQSTHPQVNEKLAASSSGIACRV